MSTLQFLILQRSSLAPSVAIICTYTRAGRPLIALKSGCLLLVKHRPPYGPNLLHTKLHTNCYFCTYPSDPPLSSQLETYKERGGREVLQALLTPPPTIQKEGTFRLLVFRNGSAQVDTHPLLPFFVQPTLHDTTTPCRKRRQVAS
jgi:hypothetical protein